MQVSRPERKVWVNLPTLVSANLQTNCIQKFPLIYFRYNKILNLYQLQHVLSQNKMKVLIEKSFMRGYYSPLMMLQTSMGILRKGSICQRILQCLLIPDARGWNSTSFFFFFSSLLKKAPELMEKDLIKAITKKSSYFETGILTGAASANHSHIDILMSMSLMSLQWVKKKDSP